MANPFQKAASNAVAKQLLDTSISESNTNASANANTTANADVMEGLLDGLAPKKPTSKNYSIYLEDDVVAALDQLAKQNRASRSKVINTILRNALIK